MNANAKAFTPPQALTDERVAAFPRSEDNGGLRSTAREFVPVSGETQVATFLSKTAKPFVPAGGAFCRFFAKGVCRKGLDCPFRHDSSSALKSVAFSAEEGNLDEQTRTTTEYEIGDGIICCFGPGASVVRVDVGSPEDTSTASSSVSITGLNGGVRDHDVEARLSPFGTLLSLQVKKSVDNPLLFYARATFSEPNAASLACDALHGTPLKNWIGVAAFVSKAKQSKTASTSTVSVNMLSNHQRTGRSSVSIKLQWYAPSKFCWVYFDKRWESEKAVKSLNGISFRERQLEVRLQAPTFRQKCNFTVWLGNLPDTATEDVVKKFVEKSVKTKVSLRLSNAFADRDGPRVIQKLLRTFGPLTGFETVVEKRSTVKRKALARFVKERDAEAACAFFQKTKKIRELGSTHVFAQAVYSIKYNLQREVFTGLRSLLQELLQSHECIRYRFFDNARSCTISITADRNQDVVQVRKAIDPLVTGIVVRDKKNDNRPLWDRRFLSDKFQDFAKSATKDGQSCVAANSRLREIRVFGLENCFMQLHDSVLEYWESCQIQTHSVPIEHSDFRFILSSGRDAIDKLIVATGAKSISLDIKNSALLVEGTTIEANKALRLARNQNVRENITAAEAELCPIYFCPPDEEGSVVRLHCKHSYCRDCFDSWFDSNRMVDFPITCLKEECGAQVALSDMRSALQRNSLQQIFRSSFDSHVRKTPSLEFCLDPTCDGVFEIDSIDPVSFCSTCGVEICTQCNVSHPDISCEEYAQSQMPPDHLRLKIVDEILTLRCPRCRQAFLDFDGCFALRCNHCPCAFCGWCLEDCGTDAHPHVRTCCNRPPGHQETYFGTEKQFIAAQKNNRERKVREFLLKLSKEDATKALESCKVDLADLGIKISPT